MGPLPPPWINLCLCFVIFAASTVVQESEKNGARNSKGLFPNVFNLAATSIITVNATCGEGGPERYCKLVEHVFLREEQMIYKDSRESHCAVCDSSSPTADKRHPISHAIDGTNRWWQSPTLQNGKQFEWVTITLDLGQVYQVFYVIVKAAISPLPGNWILERSLDGIIYKPWQYYSLSDTDCWETYGIRPTIGNPYNRSDDEVICTSYYSKLNPLENGEIHTSLVNGRPGVDGRSIKLREFTKARYVRLRLQKIRTLNADLMTLQTDSQEQTDKSVTRRYFYSIRDISVGGQCVCSGHAKNCSSEPATGRQQCKCEHNTCGENCEKCCPLYNQKLWRPGTNNDGAACEKCECFGHAEKCHYDEKVAKQKTSLNIEGKYEGGGICDECKNHTMGINCDQCEDGYFRPVNIPRNHHKPCRKCQCLGPGMAGTCVKDDSHVNEGLQPGSCLCKAGFSGRRCDRCAVGYRNFPLCEPCPCHSAGTVGGTTCEGDCVCKANVEGTRCEHCKHGYYHLTADNPDGCSQCFCYGYTDQCTEGDWGVELIQAMEKWQITDFNGTRIVKPTPENGNLVIANDDVADFTSYYWLAPPDYLGKKLYSYGADLKFTISYVVARGDTSGTYTENADVILEGNGIQVGHNWGVRAELDEVSISLPLREQGWFLLAPSGEHGGAISRDTFALLLSKLTKLLIRAKFHTDQIEGRLHNIGMEIAAKESKSLRKLKSVEKCLCPPGYDGLSCEFCASGYRQIRGSGLSVNCERCDCYNHAESCHPDTGRCQNCLHHTRGVKCERCQYGYYGDATVGTPGDCKRCACPLEKEENNFSPTCVAITSDAGKRDYRCNQCPPGYEADKCEKCADGYFGIPQIPGGNCQPCDCSGNEDRSQSNWCDGLTGQCIKCLGNTAGWNCGECLPGYYGSAEHRTCTACSCNSHGSLSPQCDHSTGQCTCRPNVVGRTCNRCAEGYGNVEAGCIHCRCNEIGSRSPSCDPVTGHCFCKPGVFGTKCNSCLEGHFGFSSHGCQECSCNPLGAQSLQCDERSGQCSCKLYVTGRACDRCEDGYWNLNSGAGCEKCHCNHTGSTSSVCEQVTGQCTCKPGVGGKYCGECLPGHYRYSAQGCRRCDPCDIPGHICDPKNGRCVCPPYTTGRRCHQCVLNAWGYDPVTGCKPCDCSSQGSPSQTCDPTTGNCICLEGFEGHRCDQCRHGFYSFPNCNKCNCNEAGTDSALCQIQNGVCQCNEIGQCPCKEQVTGRTCDECAEGAFGLSANNSKGCHECFCFGRTKKCGQANMVWTKVSVPDNDIFMEIGTSEIPTNLGFHVIPEELPNRRLGIPYVLDQPLYWKLPKEILGDKVLSYNGYLTFNAESHGNSRFPDTFMQRYPLLLLKGNQRIVLVHSTPSEGLRMPYRVRLHEGNWKIRDNPHVPVDKKMMMIALQNLQAILIRGTDGPDVRYARLQNVSLDAATSAYQTSSAAVGVEMCRCPRQYTGSSCQDPAPGFYRKRKPNYLDSKDILDLVGWAEPCSCNNHTNICDRETGICMDCTGNTIGNHCDQCIKGYYGDPARGPCRPCACPHLTNSFSDTCVPDAVDYICVDCQEGYSGRHCEKCARGYYGDPLKEGGQCTPCKCNPYGSRSRDCDPLTGLCQCQEGISGRDCTVCSHGFILTEYGCKSCEDECTGILLRELYQLRLQVEGANLTDIPTLPWSYLNKLSRIAQDLKIPVSEYERKIALGKELVNNFTFYFDLETKADLLRVKADNYIAKGIQVSSDAKDTLQEAEKLLQELNGIKKTIQDLIAEMEKYPSRPGISADRLLLEAERIIREIQSRNFQPDKENANRELRKAIALLNNVKGLTVDHVHLDDLKDKLNLLDNLLKDIVMKVETDVKRPVERTAETVRTGRLRQNEVQGTVDVIANNIANSNKTLKDASDLLGKARNDIIDASVKFQFLPRLLRDLENATGSLEERRGILSHLNSLYKDKYVIPAQKHADDLEKQSQHLASLFTATRELSEFPLQAAKAYQRIIDALNAAEIAAREADKAAERAYFQAYPQTDDALTDQAEKARARSLQLLAEAQKLSDEGIPVLEQSLRARKKDLNELAENIAYGQRGDDIINRELDGLPKGVSNSLKETAAKLAVATAKANDAEKKVDAIVGLLEGDLAAKLEAIHAGTIGGFENLTKTIQRAREDIKDASKLADRAYASSERVRNQNSAVRLNLKELKDKILLARQKASSIRVSLSANKQGECVRSFKPVVEPSTTNNIVLNYAINNDLTDSLLFYLGSGKEEDFMAIEMVNRKIRFLWNAGGGTQVIQHNTAIETNSENFLKNGFWFKIEANRIGNLGTLSVKKTPDGQKPDPFEVSGASPVGYTKMDLDSTSHFFIGGLPDNYLVPSELRTSSFSGCLYEVILDGKQVGLWNFLSNKGCDGCKEGATEDIDVSAYEFQGGSSYAIVPMIPYYKKNDLYAVLSFKTLNEDGLLFLSCNPRTGEYISLELKDGKVVYQLKHSGGSRVILQTANKYNTGKWTRVEAAREKFEAQMLVEEEFLEKTAQKQGSSALDLKDSSLYYGGVPPNFTTEKWHGITFSSFFGCLKDLQIDSTPLALSQGSFYGMRVGCSDRAIKAATFKGAGYLELNGQSLSSDSSFSFSFLTRQKDALLLLSTFSGKQADANLMTNFYSVALEDGKIKAKLDTGIEDTTISSDRYSNDGNFHTITIIRKNRRLFLRVDDVEESELRLPKGAKDISSPKSGGLFFGGVKEGVDVRNMAVSQQNFMGIIKDAVFNDRLLRFEEVIEHKGVSIGISDLESMSSDSFRQITLSHPEEGCAHESVEKDASDFDAIPHRHFELELERKDISRDFNITFEILTYGKEGILISAKNYHKKQHFLVSLENNYVVMEYKKRKEEKSASSSDSLDRGKWHKIQVIKFGKTLSLYINNKKHPVASMEVPKRLMLKTPLYLGGMPQQMDIHTTSSTASLKGCIRNLSINSIHKDLPETFTSCFENKEPGFHLTGDGYITYDSHLYIGNRFEISLQFQTVHLNGVLISMFSSFSGMLFKLKLINKSVSATMQIGQHSKTHQISQDFEMSTDNCNKKWHTIVVTFSDKTLRLKVDELKSEQKVTADITEDFGSTSLYIGGSPRNRKPFTEKDQHFIGCLRNIFLNGKFLNMEQAESSHNVKQQPCLQR